mgnify:CR=1 FL=1
MDDPPRRGRPAKTAEQARIGELERQVARLEAEAARKDTAAQRDELRRANYVASVGLAAASLETGEVGLARAAELLLRCLRNEYQADSGK